MSSGFSKEAERIFADALAVAEEGPVNVDVLCDSNPSLADELRGLHGNWLRIRELLDGPAPLTAELEESSPARELERAGPYVFISRIGEGGQGAVFLAEDTRIRRRVAVKVLRSPFVSGAARLRFRREAEIVAGLDHPGICGILEAEVEGEVPYIAMPYVQGTVLLRAIETARERERTGALRSASDPLPLCPRSRRDLGRTLGFFERIARALNVAHLAGVVHRDVKPANVIVTPGGDPVVLDFGMARAQSADGAELTFTGDLFGTPHYMSPEQWSGRRGELDARTDVYALGVTLFEALTLARPFEGDSPFAIQRAILSDPVPDSRALNDTLGADVQVVLETALEKDPARRYSSALALAEDLRRIREHEPIEARPAGPALRLRRWARREPAIAAALTSTFFALLGGLLVALSLLAETHEALDEMYAVRMAERSVALSERDGAAALALSIEALELSENHVTRSAVLETLDACGLERRIAIEHANRVRDLALSLDGRTAAVALDGQSRVQKPSELEHALWIIDVLTGDTLAELASAGRVLHSVALAPDASWVAAGGAVTGVELWRLPAEHGAAPSFTYGIESGPVVHLEASRDGRLLAAQPLDGQTLVFDVAGEQLVQRFEIAGGTVGRARFSPDAAHLLVSSALTFGPPRTSSNVAWIFDVATGAERAQLKHAAPVLDSAFSSDGRHVATADADGRLHLWDGFSGVELRVPIDFDGPLERLAFGPAGRLLAAGGVDAERPRLTLLDLATGDAVELAGHTDRVMHLSFDPTGERLASSSRDSTTRLWDVQQGTLIRSLRAISQPHAVRWTPDGRRVVTFDQFRYVRVWRAGERPGSYALRGHEGAVRWASFLPGGARIASAGDDGTLRIWSAPRGPELDGHEDPGRLLFSSEPVGSAIHTVRLSGDGRALALGSGEGAAAAELDLGGAPRLLRMLHHDSAAVDGVLLPSGGVLLVDESGDVWRFPVGDPVKQPVALPFELRCRRARIAPDGSLIALTGDGPSVVLMDARTLRSQTIVGGSEDADLAVQDLAWRPDSNELAVAYSIVREGGRGTGLFGKSPVLRRYDVGSGECVAPELDVASPRAVTYDGTGSKLLVLGAEGGVNVVLFDLESGEKAPPIVSQASLVEAAALSADGSLFATGGRGSTVVVRDARDAQELIRHRQGDFVKCIAFPEEEADRRVVSGGADGSLFVWPLDPMPAALVCRPRELDQWERLREERNGVLPD